MKPIRVIQIAAVFAVLTAATMGQFLSQSELNTGNAHSPLLLYPSDHTRSVNWAGYFITTLQTGTKYQSVQGNWVVPSVLNIEDPAQNLTDFSAAWVGIGGACANAGCTTFDTTLIQLGTEQDTSGGISGLYYAWYQLWPMQRVKLSNVVRPGDNITASVTCSANCSAATQSWTLSMTDSTQNWSWSTTVSYGSSETSAEWIQEVPQSCTSSCSFTTANFPYFDAFTFSNLTANGLNPNLSTASAVSLQDFPAFGTTTSAAPSMPQGGNSFTVCPKDSNAPCNFSAGPGPLLAAVLPSSRSVSMNANATVFATVLNTGTNSLTGCSIVGPGTPPYFNYQTTDPRTNALTGAPNTPVSIPAGGAQSFLLTLLGSTPTAGPKNDFFQFACAGTNNAPVLVGLNTLSFLVTDTPGPDTIALVATQSNDGILHIPGSNGSGAFAVATANVGTGATVTVNVAVHTSLPISLSVCETNPTTGQCLNPPSDVLSTTINAGATPTFAVFATASGAIPFDPGHNRISVEFRASVSAAGRTQYLQVGGTSVAVQTQ